MIHKKVIKTEWVCDNVKVVFSEPSIQAAHLVAYITNANEIMYYYYTVTVYRKNRKNKWKKIFSVNAYDFPAIRCIPEMVDLISEQRPYLDTDSFANEDYYSVTLRDPKQRLFDLFIGYGIDDCGRGLPFLRGIKVNNITEHKVFEFKKTVENFIDLSIENHNQEQAVHLKKETNSFFIKEGKLYKNNIYDTGSRLESVFKKEDIIDMTIFYENDGQSYLAEFHGCAIVDILEDAITVSGGYFEAKGGFCNIENSTVKIPISKIIYTFADIPENSPKLKYNTKQCLEDFAAILTEKEKEEFKTNPLKNLFGKWSDVIAGRTWMYREEHGFKNPEKEIKKIIKALKEEK